MLYGVLDRVASLELAGYSCFLGEAEDPGPFCSEACDSAERDCRTVAWWRFSGDVPLSQYRSVSVLQSAATVSPEFPI